MTDLYVISVRPIIRFNGKFISFDKKINALSINNNGDNQIKFNIDPYSEEDKRIFNEVTQFIYDYMTLNLEIELERVFIKFKEFISNVFPSVSCDANTLEKLYNYNNGLNIVICLIDVFSNEELPENYYNIDEKEKNIIETYKVYYENFCEGCVSCHILS